MNKHWCVGCSPENCPGCVTSAEHDAAVPAPAQPAEMATVTECEACFTPDVCQLRGTCDHYSAERLRVTKAAPVPPAQAVPLTEEQMLACVRSVGVPVPMGLTRDRGPYDVTEPTWFLTQLVRAIERAHGINGDKHA